MPMPSFYRRPRHVSIATQIQASIGHRSVQEVYAERRQRKTGPLLGTETNIIVNDPRLKVQVRGGGWAKVTYTDPNASGPVTFSIRMSKIKYYLDKPPSDWFHPAEATYSEWINTTKEGALYSARRQVEGMLKVAVKKGDEELAERLRQILKKDDLTVAQFRQDWLNAHTDVEIEDFYDYEEELVW